MGDPRNIFALTILLAGVLLCGVLSPFHPAMVLCIDTDGDPDCCRSSTSMLPVPCPRESCVARTACDCCITVDAVPSCSGVSPQHLDLARSSAAAAALAPTGSRLPEVPINYADARLAALRSTVLLI